MSHTYSVVMEDEIDRATFKELVEQHWKQSLFHEGSGLQFDTRKRCWVMVFDIKEDAEILFDAMLEAEHYDLWEDSYRLILEKIE